MAYTRCNRDLVLILLSTLVCITVNIIMHFYQSYKQLFRFAQTLHESLIERFKYIDK